MLCETKTQNKTNNMDNNQHNYVSDLLQRRNLVALPNTVWVADFFTAPATISPPGDRLDIKVLIVVDLGSRELILAVPFQVKNKGNVKSSLVCNLESCFLQEPFQMTCNFLCTRIEVLFCCSVVLLFCCS